MRVAYSRTLGYAKVDAAVAALVDEAVATLAQLGAHVEEIDLALKDPIEVMQPLWAVALAMAVQPLTAEQRSLMDQPLLDLAEPGFYLSALEYRALEKQRETLARRMNLLHQQYDLLVTPQLATTAFAVNHEVPPGNGMKRWWEWSPFTYPFNLTQQPAATVPCGFAPNGLPVAMQMVGAKFAETKGVARGAGLRAGKPVRDAEASGGRAVIGRSLGTAAADEHVNHCTSSATHVRAARSSKRRLNHCIAHEHLPWSTRPWWGRAGEPLAGMIRTHPPKTRIL